MVDLTVIVGSTRPGRAGLPVSEWFAEAARAHGSFDVDVADLAAINLPFMDEPNHPRLRRYTHHHTRRWSERIDNADAVVLVVPEYNHGYAAPVKNAIDYLYEEWHDKAVGFVSYGGVAAGTRSVQQLEQVVTAVGMVPVFEAVNIPFHTQFIDGEGQLRPNDIMEHAAVAMLDALLRMDQALRPLRAPR